MWIVFLEIPPFFIDAFKAAHELGLKILYLHRGSEAARLTYKVQQVCRVPDIEEELICDTIRKIIKDEECVGIWTVQEWLAPFATRLNAEFFNTAKFAKLITTAEAAKNKFKLRQCLQDTTLNPKYALLDLRESCANPFPNDKIVVKPLIGGASIGVETATPESNFTEVLERTRSTLPILRKKVKGRIYADDNSLDHLVLVEEYVTGNEYSVEVFASQGQIHCLGICSKAKMRAPFFEEISYIFPSDTSGKEREILEQAAVLAAKELGISTGMAHMEFRLSPKGPKILDVGLRIGGVGMTHYLVKIASGINLVKAVISEFCGKPVGDYLKVTHNDLCLLYLIQVENGGEVISLPKFEFKPEGAYKIHHEHFVAPKDHLYGYPNYSGLPGFALYQIAGQTGISYKKAEALIEHNLANEKINYKQ